MTDDRVEAVRVALETALGDFQAPTPVHVALEAGSSSGHDLIWVDQPDDSRAGFWAQGDATGDEFLVQVADFCRTSRVARSG